MYESIGERGRMTEQGFIKLHRSISKWEWYKDEHTKTVFLHLLINANWEDSRFEGYVIPKGSLVVSWKSLSENCGISVQSARTAINHLKSTGEITIKSTNKFSIVSIVNWEKYQGYEEDANKQTNKQTNKQLTNNQQTTNNIKEIKNIRNEELYKKSIYQNGRNPDFLAKLQWEIEHGEQH